MSDNIHLQDSLTELLFVMTVQPKTYNQICSLYSTLGIAASMDDTLKQLGYNSFMEMVRKRVFPFLSTFVAKNDDGKDDAMPYTLYYWNKDAPNHPNFRADLFQHEQVNKKLFPISVDDTVYFEVQNSLTFLEGRKEFVRLVDYCEQNCITNRNGMIPLSKLTSGFSTLFPAHTFSAKLKTWFPNSGGIEKIVQKILFEDVDFALSDASKKKESEFGLKNGCTLEMTLTKIDDIKIGIEEMKSKLEDTIHEDTMANIKQLNVATKPTKHQSEEATATFSTARISIGKQSRDNAVPQNVGIFGDSEDEVEYRAENSEYHPRTRRSATNKPDIDVEKEADNVLQISECFSKKYDICDDNFNVEKIFKESAVESGEKLESLTNVAAERPHIAIEDLNVDSHNGVQALKNVSPICPHYVDEKCGHYKDSDDQLSVIIEPNVESTKATNDEGIPKCEEPRNNDVVPKETKKRPSMRSLFVQPTSEDLQNCCKKLGVKYDGKADEFWHQIEIIETSSAFVPDYVYTPGNNGFASVSQYFTGTEDHAAIVKETLNEYFYANIKEIVKELGYDFSTFDHGLSAKTLFSDTMSHVHIYTLGRLLGCRIAIFEGIGCWNGHNTWKEDNENTLILLMAIRDGQYFPILSFKKP